MTLSFMRRNSVSRTWSEATVSRATATEPRLARVCASRRQLGDGAFVLGAETGLTLPQNRQPAMEDVDGTAGVTIDQVEPFDCHQCGVITIETG